MEVATTNIHFSIYNLQHSLHVTSPPLDQYLKRSGGHTCTTVPVWDRVTGLLGAMTISARTACLTSERVLKCKRFLLSCPESVSATYDLGTSTACKTLPGA